MGNGRGEQVGATVTSTNTRYDRAVRLKVEEVCTEFEEHWEPDSVERIGAAIAKVPDAANLLVRELVALDCELLVAQGVEPTLERYQDLDPKWQPDAHDAFRMAQASAGGHTAASGDTVPTRQQIGDYRILREIGRGGMGVIYEAEQESLGRRVAIKTLANMHISRLAPRFEREARAVARLHHTNIIEVYGTGLDDGVPYFAMQLVEGESLSDSIAEANSLIQESSAKSSASNHAPPHALLGPGSRHHIARIGVDVARALQHAHDSGVLHRDIKPSNLLVDRDGTTLVSDFGLARLTDEQSDMTVSGDVVGTLRYSPPESLKNQFDARSDVYSLGVTLYELLTLKPAMSHTNQVQLLDAIANGDELPNLRSVDSSIPVDLDTIVQKAIAREPAARYQTASKLADDLERYLADRPIEARRSSAIERGWKWAKRKPARAALLALTTLVATVGFPLITALWLDAIEQQEKAETASKQADIAKELAEQTREVAVDDSYRYSMQLAQTRLEEGEIVQARGILDEWIPAASHGDAVSKPKDRRGWEWQYLDRKIDSSLIAIRSQFRFVWDVGLSKDGQRLLTVENDDISETANGLVVLRETMSGRKLQTCRSEKARVFSASLSPDEESVITVGLVLEQDGKYKVLAERWDLTSELPTPVSEFVGKKFIYARMDSARGTKFPRASYSRDGRYVVLGMPPVLLHASNLEPVKGARLTGRAVRPIFVDDRHYLSGFGSELRIRSVDAARIKHTHAKHPLFAHLSVSNAGRVLAVHDRTPLVRVWDSPATGEDESFEVSLPRFHKAGITPDGKSVVRTTRNGRIVFRALSRISGHLAPQDSLILTGHVSAISRFAFSEDGSILATASLDGTTRIWDVRSFPTFETKQMRETVGSIAFGDDGNSIRYAGCRMKEAILKINQCSVAGSFRTEASPDSSIHRQANPNVTWMVHWPRSDFAFDAAGARLAAPMGVENQDRLGVGFATGVPVGVWSADSWELLFKIEDIPNEIHSTCFGANDSMLAIAGASSIFLYRVTATGAIKVGEQPVPEPPLTLEFGDGTLVAGLNSQTLMWQLVEDSSADTVTFSNEVQFSSGAINVSLSPSGDRLACVTRGPDTLHVFDTKTQSLVYEASAPFAVTCAQYSPDGNRIATVGYGSLVSLCDAETGQRVLTLKGTDVPPGSFPVTARVIFSPDGRKIATNNWLGQIRVWEIPADDSE